jgi:hypothetical protein
MSLPLRRVVPLALATLAACTRNPYIIGSVCPADGGADADPRCGAAPGGGTLVVDFNQSGATALGDLPLASGTIPASLRLRGERATATAWPPEGGTPLSRATGVPVPGLAAPFRDGTGAVGLPADVPAYGAVDATTGGVGTDDFALEIVLRAAAGATLFQKTAGAVGWSLQIDVGGQLVLGLGDATHAAQIASDPLTNGAWYHCLFWVSRGATGRADCDGSEGNPTTLPALASLDAPAATLAVGGGAAARVALLALYRAAPGGLGASTTWAAIAAKRFTTLAGVYPRFSHGSGTPLAGLRGSEAYLDLQVATGAPRRLFLVGVDWPRLACRIDAAGTPDCGYLSEPYRTRVAPPDASGWQPAALTLAPGTVPFVDGEARFAALVPSAASTTHALVFTSMVAVPAQVFSFFVHRDGATRVGASAGAAGTAIYDLTTGAVVSAPAGVRATIEPWDTGTFRCTYAFTADAGPTTYAVRLLDAAGNETFAGAGGPAVDVGGLQIDVNLVLAGSLLGAVEQPADKLTFRADDGNLPTGTPASLGLRVLLPAGPRLVDQAILNLNKGGSFKDQVQLYLRGDVAGAGHVKFWGLTAGATNWAFDGTTPVIDGVRHVLQAGWDTTSASLAIDGKSASMAAAGNAQPFAFDRVDVGFSDNSSGALEGLIAGLQIGAM